MRSFVESVERHGTLDGILDHTAADVYCNKGARTGPNLEDLMRIETTERMS